MVPCLALASICLSFSSMARWAKTLSTVASSYRSWLARFDSLRPARLSRSLAPARAVRLLRSCCSLKRLSTSLTSRDFSAVVLNAPASSCATKDRVRDVSRDVRGDRAGSQSSGSCWARVQSPFEAPSWS